MEEGAFWSSLSGNQETAIKGRIGGNRVVRGVVKDDVAITKSEVWRRELSEACYIVTQKIAI